MTWLWVAGGVIGVLAVRDAMRRQEHRHGWYRRDDHFAPGRRRIR